MRELVSRFLDHGISRRDFVRNLSALGLAIGALPNEDGTTASIVMVAGVPSCPPSQISKVVSSLRCEESFG